MQNFIYHNPVAVYFGPNQLQHLSEELGKYGKRVLLTYGGGSIKKIGLYDQVLAEITKAEMELFELPGIEPNPSIDSVRKGVAICREKKIDVLLAVGGGSTIDATKFIGAGVFYEGDAWDLVAQKAPITNCLPIISVLTLSAAGSEMNGGGVISNEETNEKLGLMHPLLLPKASFLDPTVTYTVSPYQTAAGTVDMIAHVMENYFTGRPDLEMLDTIMEGLIRDAIKFGPVAMENPSDYAARANLMWISTWAQNSFITGSKIPTWVIHVIEHELSAFYGITHGHGLAIVIPRWMKYVLDENTAPRFKQFGCNVFGLDANLPAMEVAEKSIEMLSDFFFKTLKLQSSLTDLGIGSENFALMAQKVCPGRSYPGIKRLTREDIENIYQMCLN